MITIKSDLTHDLILGEEIIIADKNKLEVSYNNKILYSIASDKIDSAYIEVGVGICKLIIKTIYGKENEIAYFTKKKEENFNRFSNAINEYIKNGENVELNFEDKEKKAIKKISTVMWLYGYVSKHKYLLIFSGIVSMLTVIINLIPPYLLSILIDNVLLSGTHSNSLFIELTIVLALSYGVSALLGMLQTYTLNLTGNRIIKDIRSRLFSHAIRLPSTFIEKTTTSRILSRLINDVGNTQWLMTYGIPTIATNLLTIIGISAILFSLFPILAIYVLVPIPFIVLIIVDYRKKASRIYHKNYRNGADMISKISDVMPNYMVVKATVNEDYESKNFDGVLNEYYNSQMDVLRLNYIRWPLVGFLTSMATILIWWIGGNLVIAGNLELGIITAFIAYMSMFYSPINQLGNILPFVQQAITSGDRIKEILEVKQVVNDNGNKKEDNIKNSVVSFKDVWFGYEPLLPVIKNITATIQEGRITTIVGRSGSGKTTMAKLIMRFYQPDKGSIYLGNVDINKLAIMEYRKRIAYVPQDAAFFDDTLIYNISYYLEGNVDPIKIIAASKAAEIHDDIMRFSLGYDTIIGERGVSLSGGQRQKVSLARAMIIDPEIIILDEVTSNLDAFSARVVSSTILKLIKGKTTIWITHNVDEVMSSDYVLVMNKGKLVEEGKPKVLFEKKKILYNLFKEKNINGLPISNKKLELSDYLKLLKNEKEIKITDGKRGSFINIKIKNKTFKELRPKRPFPISNPDIVILYERDIDRDSDGKEAAIIRDINKLDARSKEILLKSISLNSFKPTVIGIKQISMTGDGIKWQLVTRSGPLNILTITRRNVIKRKDGTVILIDEFNTPYEIKLALLDQKSLLLIKKII